MFLWKNMKKLSQNYPCYIGGGRVVRWCWVNFQCWGVLPIWIRVGQGPTAFAVGVGCLDIFSLIYRFSFLSPSLWETVRYRLKYCLKGPLTQNNQPTKSLLQLLICSTAKKTFFFINHDITGYTIFTLKNV